MVACEPVVVHHHYHYGLDADRLERLIQRQEQIMVDFAQAADDALQEIARLGNELLAALKVTSTPVVDPAVQAAADRLENAVLAAQASDPSVQLPPVNPTVPGTDPGTAPQPDAPTVDPTPVHPETGEPLPTDDAGVPDHSGTPTQGQSVDPETGQLTPGTVIDSGPGVATATADNPITPSA